MQKKVLITQSNYIPWKGYFDAINRVDEIVLYDEVQYTKRDWRNRNQIKTPQGLQWLSVPVEVKGKFFQSVKESRISDSKWAKTHWASIKQNYSKAGFFKEYAEIFEQFYLNNSQVYLSDINRSLIEIVCRILGIHTKISFSDQYAKETEGKNERLIEICKKTNASQYFSGPAAKNYIDENLFKKENIEVVYLDYSGYAEYKQLYGTFVHQVSIIDLIFNEGKCATQFMKSFSE